MKGGERMLKGTPASHGIGMGKATVIQQSNIQVIQRAILDIPGERERYSRAADQFCSQIAKVAAEVSKNIGPEEADILSMQIEMVRDPALEAEVFAHIEEKRINAEYAFDLVCDKYIRLFGDIEDELMRARAADFQDIRFRMLGILMNSKTINLVDVPRGSVLVAENISPSQAAMLEQGKVMGIVTRAGTWFSHIAIMARAMQIPAVVAVDELWSQVKSGAHVIVDGTNGHILADSTPEEIADYRKRRGSERRAYRKLLSYRDRETVTADGKRITLNANLALLSELSAIAENNVDGIGIFRTEFLYMNRSVLPTEDDQFKAYKRVVQALAGKPVIIRTVDVGGDKEIPLMQIHREINPNLGLRAVRYCLRRPDIFKTQLSALLRASAFGNLSILVPMISSVDEIRQVRALIASIMTELSAQNIPYDKNLPVGAMIEIPAAALCAESLARECDFFSLGTSDLTQYTLAVDRGNEKVAHLYNPIHPAVLRLIKHTVDSARGAGIPVAVCGESASNSMMIPLLIGLGVDSLSVNASTVLRVREIVAKSSLAFWREQIPAILNMSTADEVTQFVRAAKPPRPERPHPKDDARPKSQGPAGGA